MVVLIYCQQDSAYHMEMQFCMCTCIMCSTLPNHQKCSFKFAYYLQTGKNMYLLISDRTWASCTVQGISSGQTSSSYLVLRVQTGPRLLLQKGPAHILNSRQGESYILDYRAPVLLCFPGISRMLLSPATTLFLGASQGRCACCGPWHRCAPEGKGEGILVKVTTVFLLSLSISSSPLFQVQFIANACRVAMNSCCCFSPIWH